MTFLDVLRCPESKNRRNFFTPFKGRDLEIFAQIFGEIFFTLIEVSRCPESKNRKKFLALFRGRDLEFFDPNLGGTIFFRVFATFDDVLSQKIGKN